MSERIWLPTPSAGPVEAPLQPYRDAKRDFERDYVLRALYVARGNVSKAARLSGKERKDFYDLMRRCGIKAGIFRHSRRNGSARASA